MKREKKKRKKKGIQKRSRLKISLKYRGGNRSFYIKKRMKRMKRINSI